MTTQMVTIVLTVGGLLPLLTAVVQQPTWSAKQRTAFGVLLSLIAGSVTYVTKYGFDVSSPSKIVAVLVGVILASSSAYKGVWKPSGVAPGIEKGTSRSATDPDPEDVDEIEEAPDDDLDTPTGLAEPEGYDDGADRTP